MAGWLSGPKFAILAITLTLAGALFFLFVLSGLRCCLGWWWDGFFLVFLGMALGQSVGFSAMAYVPRWRDSDDPFILGGAVGVLVMVTIWLYLPENTVQKIGYVARALDGAAVGLLLAHLLKPYPDRGQSPHAVPECAGRRRPSAR